MKIGIDARAAKRYRGTGIGTYTFQLIKNMNLLDKINDYLLFIPEDGIPGIDIQDKFQTKVISQNKRDNFWEEMDIPNILKGTDMDVYHVPQNGIGLPLEKRSKFIITLHDVIPYKLPETVGPQYLEIYLREIPRIIPNCDYIITVSEHSKQDIMKTLSFPEDKIFVTHLAAEDIYNPLNKMICKSYIKDKYGIEDDFILYVGGFSPRKNIRGLIEAFSKIKSKLKKDTKLVILGKKGRSYYDYRDLAYGLGLKDDVIFPGAVPVEDLPIFYNAAFIFCYPSYYEGFGLPPLEAMACGTPTITSNQTSMPEILGGDTIYINPYDIDDIGERILNLALDEKLYNDMILKGLKRTSIYSWKKTAIETIEVFLKAKE